MELEKIPPPPPEGKKRKLLLVEDDTFLAGIYVSKFDQAGFDTLLAIDGVTGLELAQKELPDVIILDILLPKMDGFEVLERLKADPKTKNIPVILLTNLSQQEDVERGLRLGAADYLIKAHFVIEDIIAKINKVLIEAAEAQAKSKKEKK